MGGCPTDEAMRYNESSDSEVLHLKHQTNSSAFSVSTWSLHRSLGLFYRDAQGGRVGEPKWGAGTTTLRDIPKQAAERGIGQLEICHFHFPSTEPDYLISLQDALHEAGVHFLTLLIDQGDITHPDPTERENEIEEIRRWIRVAGASGAERVRIIAGDAAPTPETLQLSVDGLRLLCETAEEHGVRVVIENWHPLVDRPEELLTLLETLAGEVGLLFDFGNWHGERKYADLARIAHLAESTHAKANYVAPGVLDEADYSRCLQILRDGGFTGPHSLIFDALGDEWIEIVKLREFIAAAG